MLKQEPLVNLGIGAVIALTLLFIFDKKNKPGTNEQRIQEAKDKLKNIKEMEARLTEM